MLLSFVDRSATTSAKVAWVDRTTAADEPSRAGTDQTHPASDIWADAAAHFGRWLDGDPAGLDDLVAVMTPVLWHVVRAYRLPSDSAEDVVQATWLALVRRRDAIKDGQAVGGWLTITARREAWRTSKRATRDVSVETDTIDAWTATAPSAESAVVATDERSRLWEAVRSLDERCQRLLRVVAFEHRPDYAGLSTELGMPVGSIGPTRGRCLTKLRAALGGADDLFKGK